MSVLVLGIESSCDETAAAVVRDGREILSSVVHSQASLHATYGGVVPEIAGRSHLAQILPVVDAALEQARTTLDGIGCVAVTTRPGLITCKKIQHRSIERWRIVPIHRVGGIRDQDRLRDALALSHRREHLSVPFGASLSS